MKTKLLYLFMLMPLTGCQIPDIQWGWQDAPWSPKAKLAAARESFNAAVDVMTALRVQGKFTKSQGQYAEEMMDHGKAILDRWQASILLGEPKQNFDEQLAYVKRELKAVEIAAERKPL